MIWKSTCPDLKELVSAEKPPLDLLPPTAMHELARVLELGAKKYGRYNWRDSGVRPEVYYAAALRHLMAWASGIDVDSESKRHHLAHVMACCAIVLDALACGKLEPWQTRLTDFGLDTGEIERLLR